MHHAPCTLAPYTPTPRVAQAEHCAALGEYQEASKRTRRGFPLVAMALIHRNWHD